MKIQHFLFIVITLLASLLASLLVSTAVFAGQKIEQSLPVPKNGELIIDSSRGLIRIQGWDNDKIQLSGELDDSAETLVLENKGQKTYLKIAMDGKSHWGDGSILKIFLPKTTKLRFKGVDATFSLKGLSSEIKGSTISGDILLKSIDTNIMLSSVSGDISLVKTTGNAQIESVSGNVELDGSFTSAKIRSMSGDVSANIDNINNLKIKNVSGSTRILGHLKNDAQIKLASVSGDILYQVKGQLNAACKLSTQFGGEISNKLTKDRPQSSKFSQQKLNFVSGDGSGILQMTTVSGSVSLFELKLEQ